MKRFLIALLCAVFFVGAFGLGLAVEEVMEIANPDGELSGLSFRSGDKGYIKIFSYIGTGDTGYVWNDLIVFREMGVKKIEIFINSPGGDAFQGLAIADHLNRAKTWFDEINGHANGLVMSAAVPILASCKNRFASPGTVFMLHKASIFKWPGSENIDDLKAQSKMLSLIRERYISLLPQELISAEEWQEKINATTYFGVEEAIEWGLVDSIE
jgi:ATP-dependent protease ClpP protease subunit